MAVYANRLAALQADLLAKGLRSAEDWPVVVTTDEKDPEYVWLLLQLHASTSGDKERRD